MRRNASRVFGAGLAVLLATACAEPEPEPLPELPELPEGAELVLQLGDLEVYRAFDGEVCAGTLRRIEAHTWELAELFGMEPPRGRLILYATAEGVIDACPYDSGILGCASGTHGRAVAPSAPHELVHMFARTRTGVDPPPFLAEGLAFRLDGTHTYSTSFRELDLRELLANPSPFSGQATSEFFIAWAIDRFGFDAVLDAYIAVARAQTGVDAEEALAHSLGLSSMDELQHEWEIDPIAYYPSLPNTVPVFSAEQLAAGIPLESACDAPFTEGPFDGMIETRVRIEIPEAGQHEVTYPDTTYALSELLGFPLASAPIAKFLPDGPASCEGEFCLDYATLCADDPVPRFHFPSSGIYEFRALHPLAEPSSGSLSTHKVDIDECIF